MTAPTSSSTEAAKETSRLETFADGVALVNPFVSMAIFFGLAIYWKLRGRIPSGSG